MTIPAFLFGSLIAVLLGSLFHFWKGGGFFHILLYMLTGVVGFWSGNLFAQLVNFELWSIGPIRMGPSILSALFFLLLARWLFEMKPAEPAEEID
jgi:uncharacterized membrane protein required for colicin V production